MLTIKLILKKTYQQVKSRLKGRSIVIFDKGANSIDNLDLINEDGIDYFAAKS